MKSLVEEGRGSGGAGGERVRNDALAVASHLNDERVVDGMRVVDRLLREHGMMGDDEVWVHGLWKPAKWWACLRAVWGGKKLVRMTHGSLSPIYLERQGRWKKRLVKPIEKLLFRLADRVVVTGEWEIGWFKNWWGSETKGLRFEIVDLKPFFRLEGSTSPRQREDQTLHVLFLGRRHPLKGLAYLEEAAREMGKCVELRVVSNHFGEELERDWAWCDVLCLPSLSENFGLVVAEALERGKVAIVSDGAPAWGTEELKNHPKIIYMRGFVASDDRQRVKMIKSSLLKILTSQSRFF